MRSRNPAAENVRVRLSRYDVRCERARVNFLDSSIGWLAVVVFCHWSSISVVNHTGSKCTQR